jgi:hypothetical protein
LASTQLRVGDYCHAQVRFRLNTGGTGFFNCKECHKAYEIIPLQTTRKENNGKTEEALARTAVTGDGTDQRVQSFMLMMMMMMVIPFSAITSSNYPVPSTVLKL